ncbi:ATP-dependent helicase [Candidatus Pacearchaeota archaeon]|nr:ATP-dependent helicase [Candidatus Pacearchaeota archaeon]
MQTEMIFGPPGTGKTTELLSIMESEMRGGVAPNRIAFVSFTKKAADEAAERAMTKFGFRRGELPYFRTLHSLAFRELGMSHADVMQASHYRELCGSIGLSYSGKEPDEEMAIGTGDIYVFSNQLSRNAQLDLKSWWNKNGDELDWYILELFSSGLNAYKQDTGLLDFTDMLEKAYEQQIQIDVDVAIIDEAQDLTPLQWEMVSRVLAKAKRLYIAGDDDQAIYHWAGADVERFINYKASTSRVLGRSYRLPENIFNVGNSIASRIGRRVAKKWVPNESGGTVTKHPYLDSVNITEGEWLILARNKYLLSQLETMARQSGVHYSTRAGSAINKTHLRAIIDWEHLRKGARIPTDRVQIIYNYMVGKIARGHKTLPKTRGGFSLAELKADHGLLADGIWHECLAKIPLVKREYYIALLRRGIKLTSEPTVHINTIHGVKGGEADNVMLLTDMAWRSHQGLQEDPDNEHRVFYVGATRARKNLHIVLPQGENYYEI